MSPRREAFFRTILLIGLGLFLYSRLLSGAIAFYINRRFIWLTWGATLTLLIMGIAQGQRIRSLKSQISDPKSPGLPVWSYLALLVPLFLAVVWRERAHWTAWLASLVATAGLFLLSVQGEWSLNLGDALELAGAVLWALHVILIGRLARQADALRLSFVQNLTCGLLTTALGMVFEFETLGGLSAAWWTAVNTRLNLAMSMTFN